MDIRRATIQDLPHILSLFIETVRCICSKDYSEKKIKVWCTSAKNQEKWQNMITSQHFLLAIETTEIIGFGSLENQNYLGMLYVHKDFQRKGVANSLYQAIEKEAILRGGSNLISDVSITAKPFFESKGFEVVKEQKVILQNTSLINFRMIKDISDANTTNHRSAE